MIIRIIVAINITAIVCLLAVASEQQYYTRYAARVLYDGTAFRGWQDQAIDRSREGTRIRTVQGVLAKQLTSRFNQKTTCTGASRTDLGVHSRGQAIHFDVWNQPACEDLPRLEYEMNRMLPDDVRLFNISSVPTFQENIDERWHATKSATGKLYVYQFCTNAFVDPMKRRYYTHVYQPTDLDKLEECLHVFEGTHNFQAYANRVERLAKEREEKNKELDTMRTVNSIKLVREADNPGYYRIEVNLQSALYKMVRNIVGSSLHVAQGGAGLDFASLQTLLHEARDRDDNKAKPAPPEGLCLEHVYYDHY
jgi:tRNA pseudouridine38-40 synthase